MFVDKQCHLMHSNYYIHFLMTINVYFKSKYDEASSDCVLFSFSETAFHIRVAAYKNGVNLCATSKYNNLLGPVN